MNLSIAKTEYPSVSRTTILRGLGVTAPVCADPISCGAMAALNLTSTVIGYWQRQSLNNANKVRATSQAEGFVQIFYGATDADCQIKRPDGSAVWQYMEPQNYLRSIPSLPVSSPKFCADTVSGLIERCRLSEARYLLGQAAQSGQELARTFSYFANWWYQYGQQDINFLGTYLTSDAPSKCSLDYSLGATGGNGGGGIIPSTGFDTTTLMLMGGVGLLLFIMMMGR